jgi:hypothetical protein
LLTLIIRFLSPANSAQRNPVKIDASGEYEAAQRGQPAGLV